MLRMINYQGKFVLAPMVRVGGLPTRLLALNSGADLVWGPEIIDKKVVKLKRVENNLTKTVDFVLEPSQNGNHKSSTASLVQFSTARHLEKGKLIFQMGTANADIAVEAAKVVINDIDGLDINAGCPKHFSIHAGMGAALLKTPDLLCDILQRLVNEVGIPNNKPISVKIRILESEESTLELVDRLLDTGIANLTVHCRTRNMRNREPPIRDYIPLILQRCRAKNVSLIVNGGIKGYDDYMAIKKQYGDDVGAMIAEAAEQNPTVFGKVPLTWGEAATQFVRLAQQHGNFYINTKFCLARIVPGKAKVYQEIAKCKTSEEIVAAIEKMEVGRIENVKIDSKSTNEEKESVKVNEKENAQLDEKEQTESSSNENGNKDREMKGLKRKQEQDGESADSAIKKNKLAVSV